MTMSTETGLIIKGKTKEIYEYPELAGHIRAHSTDNITAGDGKRHDVIPGKGAVSNRTTSNVFRLLKACGIPVAWKEQLNATDFIAERLNMLALEVVTRRRATGSIRKREPHLADLQIFPRLAFELFLKTSGKNWKGTAIPCDDPFMQLREDQVDLYIPNQPLYAQKPFLTIPLADIIGDRDPAVLTEVEKASRRLTLALECAYRLQNFEDVDGKYEYGFTLDNRLCLGDVIDAESIRLRRDGKHYDKQLYRDNGLNPEVMARFEEVALATDNFRVPRQRIIIWSGSLSDDTQLFKKAIDFYVGDAVEVHFENGSAHKKPVKSLERYHLLIQEVPDSVVLANIGLSNGAGPTLAAAGISPVISVSPTADTFSDDVWSSLRMPSDVPNLTVLKPSNAVLAALNILSMRNPRLYMLLRERIEDRLI